MSGEKSPVKFPLTRPYLNKGNVNTKIRVGNVFTVEPGTLAGNIVDLGVYIEGFAGVRLEDVILVTENGPEILSGNQASDWLHV